MRDFLRLAELLAPHWRRVALGIALALATVLANIGLLALSSWFIASMAIAGSLGAAMDYTLPAVGVRALAVVRAAGRYAERLANHDTTFRILGSLRLWFYRRVEPLAPASLAGYRSGDLLARIRADIDTLDDYYVRGLVPAVVALLAGACILPFLSRFDPALAWIDGLGLLAAGLAAPLALAALASRPGREVVLRSAELRAALVEEIEGMAELVALGAAGPRARSLDDISASLDGSRRRLNSIRGIGEAAVVAASSLTATGSAFVLVGMLGPGGLPPADLAMLTVFALASFEAILPLPTAIQKAGEMAAAARRLFEIIDAEPAVPARPAASPRAAPPPAAGLSVRDLRFRYAPELQPIFDGLSFDLAAGARLGLAGPSGAGKSSLVSVLLRFWDYQGGTIELEGRDLRSIDPDEARGFFSVLPQSPFLYHASIRDNLMVAARPEGGDPLPEDEARLLEAIRAARLSELVSRLPEGLDTIVGETGKALSAGERQRVAIARAFLREAPIYLLDEPTEGLDDATAEALLRTMADRLAGRSIIVISHRERDLAIADRVLRIRRAGGRSGFPARLRAIILDPASAGRFRGGASCTSRSIRKSASRGWKRT
jgi:ATP-binding cassette subfamily C protein CydC